MDEHKGLINKRVLLIMPKFFGYENEVLLELARQGAIVDWLPDRPFESAVLKALTKLGPAFVLPFTNGYYHNLLKNFSAPKYDKILVINGQTVSYKLLSELRVDNPNAELILYMWDSIKNRPNVLKNISLFDRVLSFDKQSAKEFGFKHRPLFFSSGYKPSLNLDFSYDLSFIGTAHSDRYEVINRVKKNLPSCSRCYWYLYLQAKWVYQSYRLTQPAYRGSKVSEFKFDPLHKNEVQSKFSQSLAILDIEHPNQTGLTMRTLEAFGSHKKIVTTNHGIKEYDFYNSNNICIIDREKPRIPSSFFNDPFVPPALDLYQSYSIRGWIDEIIS
jgi:hypothetical protein